MSETIRETGYYWVIMRMGEGHEHTPQCWEMAYWDSENENFEVCGVDILFRESAFFAINETRILNPDEREKQ